MGYTRDEIIEAFEWWAETEYLVFSDVTASFDGDYWYIHALDKDNRAYTFETQITENNIDFVTW